MDYFFGFDTKLATKVDWFFNANHLFLLLWVAGFIVTCYFLFNAKSEKGKKITKLVLAGILFVLEVGRTVYKYLSHLHNGGTASNFNWWWNISFQMCAIMCWTTIATLILSAFLKKDRKILDYLYNILFGCALIGGVLTFCYPDCISADRPFLHFLNIQTITVHALLIFVPIYLIKIGEFKVQIRNIWKLFVGFVYIGSIAMSASLISGNNFAFCLKFDLFELGIPFPWHLPIVMIVLVTLSAINYSVFELVRYIKHKRSPNKVDKAISSTKKSKLGVALYVTSIATAIIFGMAIMLGTAALIGKDANSILGILCLLGLAYTILWLVFAEHIKKYMYENFNRNDKSKNITLLTLSFIFNLPVGILYLVKYTKDNNKCQE